MNNIIYSNHGAGVSYIQAGNASVTTSNGISVLNMGNGQTFQFNKSNFSNYNSNNSSIEKTNYFNETVDKINCLDSLTLIGTTVNNEASAGGSITATNANAKKILAGGSVTLVNSTILDNVKAGGSVTASMCHQLGKVNAGGAANMNQCANVKSIFAGHVTLIQTQVSENVECTHAEITNSQIGGSLTLKYLSNSSPNGVSYSGNHVKSGHSIINVNGMIVTSSSAGTFCNGVPLNQVNKSEEKKDDEPLQVLELKSSTVKDLIFESGKGEVILTGDSKVTGNITGGKIR